MSFFPFVNLPPELRSAIIDFTLNAKRERPDGPGKILSQRYSGEIKELRKTNRGLVVYDPDPRSHRVNALPLLLANHQIHDETMQLITAQEYKLQLSLDIMLSPERVFLPTWTCVPFVARRVDTVNVSFRLFNSTSRIRKKLGLGDMWSYRPRQNEVQDADFDLVQTLYYIFDGFVLFGATRVYIPSGATYRPFTVKNLDINVERTTDTIRGCSMVPGGLCPKLTTVGGSLRRIHDWPGRDAVYTEHPECFALWLVKHLEVLLRMDCDYKMMVGKKIFHNIGTIRVYVDGNPFKKFDLGRILADAPQSESWRECCLARREGWGWMRPLKTEESEKCQRRFF